MRRGFLNKPKPKPGHDDVPSVQLEHPVIMSNTTPPPTISNNSNRLHNDKYLKRWAHNLAESPNAVHNRLEAVTARMRDSDFKMIYRNVTFQNFEGVVLADAKIHDLIPKHFYARPSALENAYKISEAAGKGSGMFAYRDIPAGGVILVENPVCLYPSVLGLGMSLSREQMFKMLFDRLEPGVREKALSLYNSKPASVCTKEEGIVRTNGFGLDLAAPKIANPPSTQHSGTFLDLSRCNHSCGPNASHQWDLDSFSMILFARRPIMNGEEITIEYTKLDESRQVRRGRLLEMYLFHCGCQYCNLPNEKAAASDAARLELSQWQEKSFRTPLEWYNNTSLPDSYLVDGHIRCIALHEQESIIDMGYAMHVAELAIVYGMLADAANFVLWGRKAQKMLGIMRAENVTGPWEQWLTDPKRNFGLWGRRIARR